MEISWRYHGVLRVQKTGNPSYVQIAFGQCKAIFAMWCSYLKTLLMHQLSLRNHTFL